MTFAAMEINEPKYGIKIELPEGLNHKRFKAGYIFGRPGLNGLIMMLFHRNKSLEELKTDLYAGFYDDSGFNIQVEGHIKDVSDEMVMADYKGTADNKPAVGFALGLLSPYGGGALIAAIASPDEFGDEQMDVVEDIACGVEYEEPMVQSGEDEWVDFLREKRLERIEEPSDPEELTAIQFDDQDAFKCEYGAANKSFDFERFEAGGARDGGQWTVVDAGGQFILRLIFFDRTEKNYVLAFKEDHLLLNEQPWRLIFEVAED